MSEKKPGRVVFACGASIEANDVSNKDVGERLVVGTHPHKGHSRPMLNGEEQHCCFRCPSTIKLSGRKFNRVVTFEDGTRGMVMTCKITGVIANDKLRDGATERRPSSPET